MLATSVVALVVAGCGGGERQDSNEPSGTFPMNVVNANFPKSQSLAKQVPMTISVKNTGTKAIPNLAVTVDSFSTRSQQQGLADPQRPVWIVDEGPTGGTTAYTNTWALGSLAPGKTRTFTWKVTAIQPGNHTVKYRVAAGLNRPMLEVPVGFKWFVDGLIDGSLGFVGEESAGASLSASR